MSSTTGNNLRVTVFGQSHSRAIGAVIDGFPAGMKIDVIAARKFMDRRAPGHSLLSTSRKEPDEVTVLSGVRDGRTCDAPLAFMIENTDVKSADYDKLADTPRPSHADYPAWVHSGGFNDVRGGGHFSGRLTAPLCFAGALCLQYLESCGIYIGAHISSIVDITDAPFDMASVTPAALSAPGGKSFPVIDDAAGDRMKKAITSARAEGDSVGGVIECAVVGLRAGIGSPMFGTVEGELGRALFGIPAVKGIEFGSGFAGTRLRGSENNDGWDVTDGEIRAMTNNAGGALGGLTTGMPVVFRVAVKPTPSIAKAQQSVSLSELESIELEIGGRHDPCIVPRALPAVEAVAAITVMDMILGEKNGNR